MKLLTDKERSFDLTAVIKPAEDIPGRWVSHCLELDVVSEGDTLTAAMGMLIEAAEMAITDDLNGGRNPLARRAPKEFWLELDRIVKAGIPVTASQAHHPPTYSNWKALTCQFSIRVEVKFVSRAFTKPIAEIEGSPEQ